MLNRRGLLGAFLAAPVLPTMPERSQAAIALDGARMLMNPGVTLIDGGLIRTATITASQIANRSIVWPRDPLLEQLGL